MVAALLAVARFADAFARAASGSAPGASLASGTSRRVYVQTSTDGHLVVLHARPDGRVEGVVPEDPARDPFVRAGIYEIRAPTHVGVRRAWDGGWLPCPRPDLVSMVRPPQ